MNAEELLTERIQHEIDMEVLKEIGDAAGVDLTEQIELAEKKFNNKIDRVINGLTNKIIHSDSIEQE